MVGRAIALLSLCGMLVNSVSATGAQTLYRMVDDNGHVYFSDQVPPDQVQHKREMLNKKAQVLDVVEKAKTPEQLAAQKALEALRKEQQKLIAKQAASDKVLLSSFRNLDDMQKAFERKRSGYDAEQKAMDNTLARLEQQLLQQQQQAADDERNARAVSKSLLADITASQQQIDAAKQERDNYLQKRQASEEAFRADMARFEFLTQSTTGDNAANKQNANQDSPALGVFACNSSLQCQKAWRLAAQYVESHATTAKDVENDKLIMRAAPRIESDISLSVTLLQQAGERQQIFLDIRCHPSPIGNELCGSSKVQALRQQFVPSLQRQLATQ
jgi:hypothetical protein